MKLNFKDLAGDMVKEVASDFIDKTIDNITKEEYANITSHIEEDFIIEDSSINNMEHASIIQEPPSKTIKETKVIAKRALDKVEGKNLFSLPSVLTIIFFLLSSVYVDIDRALADGSFSARDGFKIFYVFLGGVVTLVARGSEGKTGVYTPKGLPGLNKEDYDNDGIPNELDETPWG